MQIPPDYISTSITPVDIHGLNPVQPVTVGGVISLPVAPASIAATGAAVPSTADAIAGRAATANPANATGGNLTSVMVDKAGRVVVTEGHVRELVATQQTTISASTSETTIVTAGAAGVFNDIAQLIITTPNAAAATLTLKDATGGTTRGIFNYPNAASAPSTPLVLTFNPPLPQAVAANNWTLTASANAGTVQITAVYVKNT
jgi:hypothetical protein